jgi:threonyl-tRNA synthetase
MSEQLDHLRHSAAHLLGAAILELYPEAKLTIGPAIEDGFYYDVDVPGGISENDLPKIEQKMRQLVQKWPSFERQEVSVAEALAKYPENEYKRELIEEFAQDGQKLTLYQAGDFVDLCRGGHIERPSKELQHFKLLSVAGAYWRGDEKNPMLTRIYGTIFPTKAELEEHLERQRLAKERDHKKLGKELGLFVFSDIVGKGLPLWTAKGATVRRELERFIVDEELKRGYRHVYTPDIANLDLYRKSGHYPYYQESMYAPITIDDEEYMLRPMTCPHHFELYLSGPHSYKELPIRFAELAKLYRYEQSGELSGLIRVRSFCLADAHIICMKSQAEAEIHGVLDLIEYLASVFGLEAGQDYHYRLSLGDRANEEKYQKDDAAWDEAESVLRQALTDRQAHFVEAEDEAAFYGPKIDVQMKNVNGKEDTAFTVQYDFVMPKRFELKYVNEQGQEEQPVVIHRSSIGAIERVMAFLIEHYGGAFPVWLAPTQVQVLPIADRHIEYADQVASQLRAKGIRAEVDSRSESLNAKIRAAQVEKMPYMVVVGDQEAEAQSVAVRSRTGGKQEVLPLDQFVARVVGEIEQKA